MRPLSNMLESCFTGPIRNMVLRGTPRQNQRPANAVELHTIQLPQGVNYSRKKGKIAPTWCQNWKLLVGYARSCRGLRPYLATDRTLDNVYNIAKRRGLIMRKKEACRNKVSRGHLNLCYTTSVQKAPHQEPKYQWQGQARNKSICSLCFC